MPIRQLSFDVVSSNWPGDLRVPVRVEVTQYLQLFWGGVMAKSETDEPGNLSRAMWVFLGYMLVGPFLAGLAVAAALIVAPIVGMELWLPDPLPAVGPGAVAAFVWAALPSALAAIIVLPRVIRIGRFGWIEAAVAGVVGFAAVAIVTGSPDRAMLPGLSFVAGLISVGVQRAMEAGRIIRGGDP